MSANKKLQVKLREWIDADGMAQVSRELELARETIARYLADLHVHNATFRWIETAVAAAAFESASERRAGRRTAARARADGEGAE